MLRQENNSKKQRGFQKSLRVGEQFKTEKNEELLNLSNDVAYVWVGKCTINNSSRQQWKMDMGWKIRHEL